MLTPIEKNKIHALGDALFSVIVEVTEAKRSAMYEIIQELEEHIYSKALQATGVKAHAAKMLGLQRTTFMAQCKKLGIVNLSTSPNTPGPSDQ